MTVRLAETRDIPGIIALLRQIGGVHYDIRPDIFRADAVKYTPEQVAELLKNPDRPIFVCDDEGEVAGYCLCQVLRYEGHPVLADRTELYLDDLCVDENRRGRGIGHVLYNHAEAYAREIGCRFLTLNVWCGNDGGIRFYENAGLKNRSIIMEKELC